MNSIALLDRNDEYQAVRMLQSQHMYAFADVYNMGTLIPLGYERGRVVVGTFSSTANPLDVLMAKCLQVNAEPWLTYVLDKDAPVDIGSLQKTAAAALSAIRSQGVDAIDLSSVRDPNEVNGEHLAMLLGCLSTWRQAVRCWDQAITVAKKALASEGKDYRDALFGLI